MKNAIFRGIFGTLVCWPLLEVLGWLGIIKPLLVAVILTGWMIIAWWFYEWAERTFRWPKQKIKL